MSRSSLLEELFKMSLRQIGKRPQLLILISVEIPRIRIKKKQPYGEGMSKGKTYLLVLAYLWGQSTAMLRLKIKSSVLEIKSLDRLGKTLSLPMIRESLLLANTDPFTLKLREDQEAKVSPKDLKRARKVE